MKVFLDTSTIIFAFESDENNSAKVFDLILDKKIAGVTNEKVIDEVRKYFRERRGRNYAFLIEIILRKNFYVVKREEILEELSKWEGKIKKKDLEQVATVKNFTINYLIAYDRDLEVLREYITPKRFIKLIGLIPFETEY